MDDDDDTATNDANIAYNLDFPVTLTDGMVVTGMHYAIKFRSNGTALTLDPQIKDYSGITGTSGWVNTPGTDSNTSTTYGYFDS